MVRRESSLALLCVAALWLSACGAIHAGERCGADLDCSTGSCLSLDTFADGFRTCAVGPKVCSKSCTADADCVTLDSTRHLHWHCFVGCDGASFCAQTQ